MGKASSSCSSLQQTQRKILQERDPKMIKTQEALKVFKVTYLK